MSPSEVNDEDLDGFFLTFAGNSGRNENPGCGGDRLERVVGLKVLDYLHRPIIYIRYELSSTPVILSSLGLASPPRTRY